MLRRRRGRSASSAVWLVMVMLVVTTGSCAPASSPGTGSGLWALIATLEEQPFDRHVVTTVLQVQLVEGRDINQHVELSSQAAGPNAFGVAVEQVVFKPADGPYPGELILQLTSSTVTTTELRARYDTGYWVPPPPPGWAPDGAGPACFVDRPWGQLGFGFMNGRLRTVSFSPGAHGSPGI